MQRTAGGSGQQQTADGRGQQQQQRMKEEVVVSKAVDRIGMSGSSGNWLRWNK